MYNEFSLKIRGKNSKKTKQKNPFPFNSTSFFPKGGILQQKLPREILADCQTLRVLQGAQAVVAALSLFFPLQLPIHGPSFN